MTSDPDATGPWSLTTGRRAYGAQVPRAEATRAGPPAHSCFCFVAVAEGVVADVVTSSPDRGLTTVACGVYSPLPPGGRSRPTDASLRLQTQSSYA